MKARYLLKQLEMLTYNMVDTDVVVKLNNSLKDVYEEALTRMPKKEGLVSRRKGDTTVIIARRRIRRAKATLQCSTLPKCKPTKSKAKQRVGSKAEKVKVLLAAV